MTVSELIKLLEQEDPTLQIAVGDYHGAHSPLGWNNSHEYSHGPVWVGEQQGYCYIGINCYADKPNTYRTVKNGQVVTVPEYYNIRFGK